MHGVAKLAVSEPQIRAVRVPVEVLIGDHDTTGGPYVQALGTVRTDWPVVKITGAGHLNCVGKEQFKQELLKWLERNAGSKPAGS